MAAHATIHPSADALRAFALGKLNDSTAAALMNHLDSCPDCCKIVAGLSGDDFLDRLRQARSQSSTPSPAKAHSETAAGAKPSSRPAIANLPPELANTPQYEILRELGRGGMGVVYLAKNKLMDRLEVLKVVNKELLDHPGAVERFLREIRSAAKLSHPNVVGAYSALQMGELLAFAMEYVEGQDLASLVKSQGPLPVLHACFYVQQAALGLRHAYEKGMVHRDIKPQNLILAREGKKHIVKVLDFGLAKATREKTDDTGLTGEGKMLGTPDYIAPEQTMDAANADIRADIYSLGCTLYYLLSGRPPFSGTSLGAVLMAHQMHEAKPLNLERPEVPEELAAVVRKMMAKSPAKRYQTPREVVQALTPFVKQGATPKASPELSSGAAESKRVVKKVADVDLPAVPAEESQESADAGESLLDAENPPAGLRRREKFSDLTIGSQLGHNIPIIRSQKSKMIRKRRAATVRERTAQKKWLIGSGIGVGMLLLALLGMWAGGVFKVKTKDGTIVLENLPSTADVLVDGERVTIKWSDGGKKAEIRVKPGTHKVEVKKDGLLVEGKELTLKDGGSEIFTVRLLPNNPDVPEKREAKATAPPPDKSPPPAITKNLDVQRITVATDEEPGFVSLFNGKDLAGWSVDGGPPGQWVVEGNTIVAQSKHFSTRNYLLTEKDYADFILCFDFKVEEGSHGGVAIRAIEGEKMPLNKNLIFDHPLIKLTNPALEGKEPTGMTHWLKNAAAYWGPVEILTLPTGIWHSMKVIVRGDNCTAAIGGKKIVDVTLDQDPRNRGSIVPGLGRRKGKVGFQINTGILRYRNIKIKELLPAKSQAPPPPRAADEDNGFVPLFNGKDLIGWHVESGNPAQWTVEDNAIVAKSPDAEKRNYLLTNREYADFSIHLQFMVEPDSFGAIALRTIEGENIGNNNLPDHPLIALVDSVKYKGMGTAYWIQNGDDQNRKTEPTSIVPFASQRWHALEITMQADHCIVRVDGIQLQDLRRSTRRSSKVIPALERARGKIGFKSQIGTIRFRNIEIKELPAAKSESPPAANAAAEEKGFVPLFNGTDLTGWKTHPDNPGDWRVDNGILIGRGPTPSLLFTEKDTYSDFHLRVIARINSGGDSGLCFRIPMFDYRKGQVKGRGYEAQINNTAGKGRYPLTGSLMHFPATAVTDRLVPPREWFTLEILAHGNHFIIWLDGKKTVDFIDSQKTYHHGHLAVNVMDPSTVVEFRKIEIKELPTNPVSPEANKTEANSKPSGSTRRAKRIGRWAMRWDVKNSREYVTQLRGLGVILAVPVGEGINGPEYEIVRDLSAQPAKLIKEEIKEIQRKEFWIDDKPGSVQGVMSVLGLRLRPSHFIAIFTEEVEKKLLHLEMDYLKRRHPGRSEDDIALTTFTVKRKGGGYVPEVVKQRLK